MLPGFASSQLCVVSFSSVEAAQVEISFCDRELSHGLFVPRPQKLNIILSLLLFFAIRKSIIIRLRVIERSFHGYIYIRYNCSFARTDQTPTGF